MIVSHKHKYIFIKCMKTAGTSIQATLAEHCGPNDIISPIGNIEGFTPQNAVFPGCNAHMHPADIKSVVGDVVWGSYLKIICVRNPWDLMVSWWHWHLKPGSFNEFVKNNLCVFDDFLLTEHLFDFYIRFEHLNEDYKLLCDKLNIPYKKLPHHIGFRKAPEHYSNYYDEETKALISNKYKRVIDMFNYDFS